MGFFGDVGRGFGVMFDRAGNWLSERPGGPGSDTPAADRNNFQLPNADARGDFLRGGAEFAQYRQAPTAADSSFRADQQGLINRLRGQMNGDESLSALQLRGATDANMAAQRAMAASATPGNQAMAQRMAMQNTGKMNQGFGHQAAMLGIQERNAAANALGGVAQGARGQDLQNNQFNANAQLQQRGLNDQYALGMSGLELANAQGVQRGNMGYEQNQTQRYGIDKGTPQQPSNFDRLVGVAGSVAPFLLAKGGVVTQPTDAIVGEAGPEAIVPLSNLVNATVSRGGTTGLDWLRSAADTGPDTSARDGLIKAGQASSDPFMRGMSGIAGAWAARKDRQAAEGKMRNSLASQLKPRASLSGVMGGMPHMPGDEEMGYRMMAEGGVVTKPTRAVIGEEGPEAVIPLAQLPELVGRLAQHVRGQAAPAPTQSYGPADPRKNFSIEVGEAQIEPSPVSHERDYDAEFPWWLEARNRQLQEEMAANRAGMPQHMRGRR